MDEMIRILTELKADPEKIAVALLALERLLSRKRRGKRRGRPPSWLSSSDEQVAAAPKRRGNNDPPPHPPNAAAVALPRTRRSKVWAVAGRKPPLTA